MDQRSRLSGLTPKEPVERSEFGDLMVVTRRALMVVCSYIERRYGTDEPRFIRVDRDDGKKRAA